MIGSHAHMADHNTHHTEGGSGAREVFLRTIAIVGLLAVLVLGAWGIILLAFNLPSVFGNIGSSIGGAFGGNTDGTNNTPSSLTVSAPESVINASNFQVKWDQDNAAGYTYTLAYRCNTGVTIKAPRANGNYEVMPCDTEFNEVSATAKMRLIGTIDSSAASRTAYITVTAYDTDGNSVDAATAEVDVKRMVVSGTPSNSNTNNNNSSATYVPAAVQATQLYGYGDLAVTITSVQPTYNQYGQQQNTRRYTMQFTITNVGTNVVQSGWNFNALIPWTPNTYTFASQAQQALYPGDKIVYTLGFDAYVDGQVCTMQYPNNCQYQNPNYNYYNNQNITCGYRYNGYTNIYSCGYTDVNGNWIDVGTNYNQNQYQYPYNTNRVVTVTADPNNWVPELNENNNRATTYLTY